MKKYEKLILNLFGKNKYSQKIKAKPQKKICLISGHVIHKGNLY
jgi:hypothetical protein